MLDTSINELHKMCDNMIENDNVEQSQWNSDEHPKIVNGHDISNKRRAQPNGIDETRK